MKSIKSHPAYKRWQKHSEFTTVHIITEEGIEITILKQGMSEKPFAQKAKNSYESF